MEAGGSGHRAFCGGSNKSPASPTPEQAVPDFLQRLLTLSSKQPVEVPRGQDLPAPYSPTQPLRPDPNPSKVELDLKKINVFRDQHISPGVAACQLLTFRLHRLLVLRIVLESVTSCITNSLWATWSSGHQLPITPFSFLRGHFIWVLSNQLHQSNKSG